MKSDDPVRMLAKRPAVHVQREATLRAVAETLANESIGAVLVRHTEPPGLVSERDVVRALAEGADPDQERAGDVMTEDVASLAPDATLAHAVRTMLDNEIRHLPVLEDGVTVGMVSARDVLAALAGEGALS
jgi:signal-transduction protein with cAMP-binding, CBS, and nucleotidyltransferase domain